MRSPCASIAVAIACVLVVTPVWSAEKPLTNKDVLSLVRADVGDEVILAKIRESSEVNFDTSPDALISLKKDGVSKTVIAAMLDRASGRRGSTPVGGIAGSLPASGAETVRLLAEGKSVDLAKMLGTRDESLLRLGATTFHNFQGAKAATRVQDRNPVILIAASAQPMGQYFVVRTDPNAKKQLRSVKVGHGFYGMQDSNSPDPDWTIPYEAVKENEGLWRLKLAKTLAPGEYGVYVVDRNLLGVGELYDFGVD